MKLINLRNLLSILMIVAFAIGTTNCKSKKQVTEASKPVAQYEDEVEVKQFCSGPEFMSSEGFIRARSYGESSDMGISSKVAKSNTLSDLASKIEVTVQAVIDNYNSRRMKDMNESIEKRYEELIREVVNQKINGYKTICDKVTKTKENKYRTYYVFELPVDNVLNPVYTQISKDDELKVDYDYQKFKKTFEEEIKKTETK